MTKINRIKINSNKKYKLYRSFAGLTLATITLLSGCSLKDYSNNIEYKNNNYTSSTYSSYDSQSETNENKISQTQYIDNYINEEDLGKILSAKVNLSNQNIINFNQIINSIKTDYFYSEVFGVSEALDKYNNIQKYSSNCKNLFSNNLISGQTIYEFVTKNNLIENYKNDAKISESDLKLICNKIAETINYIAKETKIDFNLMSEKIKNLKIRNFTGFSNGSYDSTTGVMWLDVSKLKSSDVLFKSVISHETVHLIQANSLQETNQKNYESRLGCSYTFNDLKVNALNWTWFSEGAAETVMMNENSLNKALTYDNLIRMFETIKMATFLNDNNEIDDFEKISVSNDLNILFKYFGCKTEQEKLEIIEMMFSCEIISGLAGSKSANEFYDSTSMDLGERRIYQKQIKGSIAQTLSKQFYKNLANKLGNKEVTINEIFELISIFESEMSKLTWYSSEWNSGYIDEFFENYINIQENFFQMLSSNTNLTFEDIQKAYDTYNENNNYGLNDFTILSSSKKEFVTNVKANRKNDKTKSINYFYQNLNYRKVR